VSTADEAVPVSAAEANALFADLAPASALVLAVSGGPDSTALLVLAARWRAARKQGPKLLAVTIDHGLRSGSAAEARAVKKLAGRFGVEHRTLRWRGEKPASAIQAAARAARYRLLAAAAKAAKARHILTAHTLDDQAETVLFRMARGSGLTGLGAMVPARRLPAFPQELRSSRPARGSPPLAHDGEPLLILRPLLGMAKARLVATLAAAGVSFADDPSNRDPRFARVRVRKLLPILAAEGLDARRLALLARRLRRADATIELAVDVAGAAVSLNTWTNRGPIRFRKIPPIACGSGDPAPRPRDHASRRRGSGRAWPAGNALRGHYRNSGDRSCAPDAGRCARDAGWRRSCDRTRTAALDPVRCPPLNHAPTSPPRHSETAVGYEKAGSFPWQGAARHIDCDLGWT
jgi:tRNA(Ile)-lysidine synthase